LAIYYQTDRGRTPAPANSSRFSPVVSNIFADLKILHTRFARLVLGVAVLEDIVLWLALALATAMAGKTTLNPRQMSYHLISTIAFFALGLTIIPRIIKRSNRAEFNVLAKNSPVGYAIAVLLAYCVVAGTLDVSLVFAAFLAGTASRPLKSLECQAPQCSISASPIHEPNCP
jgi:Kef-type K+ transport system membrane component KefB